MHIASMGSPLGDERRRTRLIKAVGLLAIVLILGAPIVGCSNTTSATPRPIGEGRSSAPRVPTVTVAPVTEGAAAGSASYSGEVKPRAQVSISAKLMARIEQLHVDVGTEVKAGDPIATLEGSGLNAQLRQAEAGLRSAQARLAQVEGGPRPEAVAQAEANLRAAEARLVQLKAGPTSEQLRIAETQVRVAKNQLFAVQSQADAYLGTARLATPYTEEMKEAQSGVAWEQAQLAEAQLAQLKAGSTPEQLAQAQAGVDAAQAQLELTRSPFTDKDLEAAQGQVAQARAAVDLVKTQMADLVVSTPMDGVVSERYLVAGSLASPSAPIVMVVTHDLEITIAVDETRSGEVAVGQAVTVTVGAYSDREFAGTVSSVAPTVDPRTRTVGVKVSIQDPDRQLKAGMFAQVVLAGEGPRVSLFVPAQAVAKRGDKDVIFVVSDGRLGTREVQIGERDGDRLQILGGLAAGEMVVLSPPADLRDGDPVTVRPGG